MVSKVFLSVWLSGIPFSIIAQVFDQQSTRLHTPYEELSGYSQYLYDSSFYEEARVQQTHEYITFTYQSDGLSIEGYACRPKGQPKEDLPIIIYNRGGTGNFGKLTPDIFPYFYELAREGFVVFGSNYRFVGDQGKHDELGGAEVRDLLKLYHIVKALPGSDSTNVFMMGVSRGGLMTYLAARELDLNAVAVFSGVSNSQLQYERRPIFIEGWDDTPPDEYYLGLASVLPDFQSKKEEYLLERSPTAWADEINSPVLILHSRQDGFVRVEQAYEMAKALEEAQKPYQLKVYDQKSHALPAWNFDSIEETITWFQNHMNER